MLRGADELHGQVDGLLVRGRTPELLVRNRRALRLVLDPYPGTAADVAAVMSSLAGGTWQIAGGYHAEREGAHIAIHPGEAPEPPAAAPLPVPGEIAFGPWTIRAGPPDAAGLGRHGATIGDSPLVVRVAEPGDRVAIRGGAKKVSDALAEAGVPPRLRTRWPVVESDGRIVWVVAIRGADGAGDGVGVAAVKS